MPIEEFNIFGEVIPEFKFSKDHKIKLFESFAGIGCQRLALKRITNNYESVGISEIDTNALKSYEAIHGDCKNYGSITDIHKLPEIDIFTYSFPCTDLSKAGKQAGLNDTRSGLVYEVLRVLNENKDNLPKVLIMENVVDLIQVKFVKQFNGIQKELENLGYTNYTFTMNSKDYGIPQTRNRVFMVSILGNYFYKKPNKKKLQLKLKDLLEENVDESFYLSRKMINYCIGLNMKSDYPRKEIFERNLKKVNQKGIAATVTTAAGQRPTDNFILDEGGVLVPNNTKKGYLVADHGDGIDISSRMDTHRGTVQKGMAQTIKTQVDRFMGKKDRFQEGKNIADTLLAAGPKEGIVNKNLRIRKLTPKECWRLMGIDDEDYEKAAQVVSKSALYKQAGNGIVVDVFYEILKNLMEVEQ